MCSIPLLCFETGAESREESQQDGVQGRKSQTGEADVEPENERSRPEALVAGCRRSARTDFITADGAISGHASDHFSGADRQPQTQGLTGS